MRFHEVGPGEAILNWGRELGCVLGVLGGGGVDNHSKQHTQSHCTNVACVDIGTSSSHSFLGRQVNYRSTNLITPTALVAARCPMIS